MVGALADAMIVTGAATGRTTSAQELRTCRQAAGQTPVIAGSGVGPASIGQLVGLADGFIVGSRLQRDGRAVDPERVAAFLEAAGEHRI